MRRVPFAILLLVMALVAAACGTPAASQGEPDQSTAAGEPSVGGEASEAAQPSQGGGGGGANGSITYQITGDVEKSGEVPFQGGGGSSYVESEGGWLANFAQPSGEGAYILLNTFSRAQILTFGDGEHIIAVGSDESTGYDCTFNLEQNDASGLRGSMSCNDVPAGTASGTEILTVDISAEWDARN